HEGVLADSGRVQEFFGLGSAHGTCLSEHWNNFQAQALEDLQVRTAVGHVGLIQTFIIDVKGVGILHDEFTAAQQASTWACFVAVLVLDLVQVNRQVLVRVVQVLNQQREHFLVAWSQDVVRSLAVLEAEQAIAVFSPTSGLLIRFTWQQCREVNFLCTNSVHFLANDSFNSRKDLQTQRQPGINTRGRTTDVTSAYQQLMAGDFGVNRIFTQGAQEGSGKLQNHSGCPFPSVDSRIVFGCRLAMQNQMGFGRKAGLDQCYRFPRLPNKFKGISGIVLR